MALQALLQNQYHPPDQLQQVRNQVTQLKYTSSNSSLFLGETAPSHTPSLPHNPPQHQASPSQLILAKQTPVPTSTPQPADLQALMSSRNLAGIIANAQKASQTPPMPQTALLQPGSANQAQSTPVGASDLLASLKRAGMLNTSSTTPIPPQNYGPPPLSSPSLPSANSSYDVQLDSASLKV